MIDDGGGPRFPLPPGVRVEAIPGGADNRNPFSYHEIQAAGAMAIGNPYEYFDQENKRRGKLDRPEEAIACWLDNKGVRVRSVDEKNAELQSQHRKIPDGVFDWAKATVEFKTVAKPTRNAVRAGVRAISVQSRYGVVDFRAAGVDEQLVRDILALEVGRAGNSLTQIVMVLADDHHLEWRHG